MAPDPKPIASPATLMGPGTLVFNGATFTLSSSGSVTLQLTGLRGAANQLDFDPSKSMQVLIGLNPSTEFSVSTDQLLVGQPEHGLYVGSSGKLVCTQAGISVAEEPRQLRKFSRGPLGISLQRA